jgi:prenyltransferase beta subunit
MLQVARLAPNLLGQASSRIVEFIQAHENDDGGIADRAGQSDLYYTVFGLEGLVALRAPVNANSFHAYLDTFGDGTDLDFVHAACLARCRASLPEGRFSPEKARALAAHIETCRCPDGGYGPGPGADHGTVYHSFLALGAYEDLGLTVPELPGLVRCVEGLRTGDGAYANAPDLPMGTTPATAAAVTLLRKLGEPVPPEAGQWLLDRAHPQGGFTAVRGIDVPDLLSTATALHALSGMHVPFEHLKEPCLDFLDSLWTGKAFCGSWADDAEDCEYTYYALLALGHLSLS